MFCNLPSWAASIPTKSQVIRLLPKLLGVRAVACYSIMFIIIKRSLYQKTKFLCSYFASTSSTYAGMGTSANPRHHISNPKPCNNRLLPYLLLASTDHIHHIGGCVSDTLKSPYVGDSAFLSSNVFLVDHLRVAWTPLAHVARNEAVLFGIV